MIYTEFKEAVMACAARQGLTEYDLFYSESSDTSVEVLKDEVKSFLSNQSSGACFRCIYQGKLGYAATELFTREQAEELVHIAMENAACIEADDQVVIHSVGDVYQPVAAKPVTTPTSAQLIDAAQKTLSACFAASDRVVESSQAGAMFTRNKVALCNSKGLDLQAETAFSFLAADSIVADSGEAYFGVEFKPGDFAELDPQTIAKLATERAISKIGADAVASGKYTVVISNDTMAALLAAYNGVFSADNMQKGLSLLQGKEGTVIASPLVTLMDNPFYADSLVQMPFDHEGVATCTKKVIDNGVFQTALHNLTTAARANCKSTGNGAKDSYASSVGIAPFTFYLEKGQGGDLAQMLAHAHDGLYITQLDGLHAGVDAVSGDFSLAARGYRITDGKRGKPVCNITLSGNFFDLMRNVCMVGNDLKLGIPTGFTCYGSPSVMVKNMSVAGK